MLDGKHDGKISGSIWNKYNPDKPIDENSFKNVDEAIAEQRANILQEHGVTEEEVQAYEAEARRLANEQKLKKIKEILKELEEKLRTGSSPIYELW